MKQVLPLDYCKSCPADIIVALTGNPNVGKSTLFNALTGLRQHTGNWAGKTVENAKGECCYQGRRLVIADLPGCYSLFCDTAEESAAAGFLKQRIADVAVVVLDPVTLERGLELALQVGEICPRTVVCLNFMDEAKKRGIQIDEKGLGKELGMPVIPVTALRKEGIENLLKTIVSLYAGREQTRPAPRRQAEELVRKYVCRKEKNDTKRERKLDALLTGKWTAVPCMLLMLLLIFYITLEGANIPSAWLSSALSGLEIQLSHLLARFLPEAAVSFFAQGVFRTVAWIVSVMLPPMAIFFPLFTLAEDCGLLPRIAFNLDRPFACCRACGKQALTMCMGFGCNAVGVTGCRIISSRREKLLAVLTNCFVPCNGRFPLLIALITVFLSRGQNRFVSALMLTGFVLLGIGMTFLVSALLSRTVLRGETDFFCLEMPPFRKPRILSTIVRSVLDRTVFVLARAVSAAVPAGAVLWLAANCRVFGDTVLGHLASLLEVPGHWLGLDGEILLGFLFAFPANEIVLPVILMAYTGTGVLSAVPDYGNLVALLTAQGWTALTAVNTCIFTLFHWPCATTVKTIRKETGSRWVTLFSVLLPTFCGICLCFIAKCLFLLLT